jgi:DHA1 family putative efflux transporter-like MFS transporter
MGKDNAEVQRFEFLIASRINLALSTGVFIVTALTVVFKMALPEKSKKSPIYMD